MYAGVYLRAVIVRPWRGFDLKALPESEEDKSGQQHET